MLSINCLTVVGERRRTSRSWPSAPPSPVRTANRRRGDAEVAYGLREIGFRSVNLGRVFPDDDLLDQRMNEAALLLNVGTEEQLPHLDDLGCCLMRGKRLDRFSEHPLVRGDLPFKARRLTLKCIELCEKGVMRFSSKGGSKFPEVFPPPTSFCRLSSSYKPTSAITHIVGAHGPNPDR